MGLTPAQMLRRVELPLALPAIMAGLRIATVSTIALATVAAFVIPQGLGRPIFLALRAVLQDGVHRRRRRSPSASRSSPTRCSCSSQRPLTPWTRVERRRDRRPLGSSPTRSASSATTRACSGTRPSSTSAVGGRARRGARRSRCRSASCSATCTAARSSRSTSSNIGRALPSLAVIAIGLAFLGVGFTERPDRARRARRAADPHERLRRRRRGRPRRGRGGPRDGHDASARSSGASSCRSRCR